MASKECAGPPAGSRRHARRSPLLPVLFLASLALLCAGALVKGPFISVDTHKFLSTGEDLVRWLVTGQGTFEDLDRPALFPHYVISSMVLSGLYTYLDLREWGVVAFNCLLFALIVCAVFSVWRLMYAQLERPWERATGIVGVGGGGYVIYGLPDGFLWSYAILTDVLFLAWITLFTVSIVKGLLVGGRVTWILALVLAATAPFVRPPGIIAPLLYCFALALHLRPVSSGNFRSVAAVAFAVPAIVVLVFVPYLVLVHDAGSVVESGAPDFLARGFNQAVILFKSGIVVSNRIEVADPVLSYGGILKTMGYRLAYYLIPIRLDEHAYSAVHNLVNGVYMLVALPLLAAGIKNLMNMGRRQRMVMLFLVMTAYAYTLLHAVTLVSFDWRYQLPAMVPLWLLAGCGLFSLLGFQPRRATGDDGRRP